jgi:hypothetical protein
MAIRITIADMQLQIDRLRRELEEARQETGRPPTYVALRKNVRFLTETNKHVRQMADSARKEATNLWYRVRHLERELEEARNEKGVALPIFSSHAQPSIDSDMLARLIRLSHPDKHGNSKASNEATAWLLALRKAR